ncbi:iron-containing redox enzyme family protein [Verticiella sediminum]
MIETLADMAALETLSNSPARHLYEQLYRPHRHAGARLAGIGYLREALARAEALPCELPDTLAALPAWMLAHHRNALARYAGYLEERRTGAPRRYFSGRAHALYALRNVAPTKAVDGAWLYGLLMHWPDRRYHGLIRTYLEELGDGDPAANHVAMYARLLATQGCEHWQDQDDAHYEQGVIQLALANNAATFTPEILGFNLGYEQLPLHLLITSYELRELGIDPYYFTVHITVDNGDTGHARKAIEAVLDNAPLGDAGDYWRRVRNGYRLNALGMGTTDIIAGFSLESEVVRILKRKSKAGRGAHSDYCRIGGRHVNDWLQNEADITTFLAALQKARWIRRGEPAEASRFWRLIDGPGADMFGVFTPYEQTLIREWIESRPNADGGAGSASGVRCDDPPGRAPASRARAMDATLRRGGEWVADDEVARLQAHLATRTTGEQCMQSLIAHMAPALHHTPVGLWATREFARRLAFV